MLVGLDLDGVLCDLGPGVAARIEREFGVVTHPAAWRQYDLRHLELGIPERAFVAFLDGVFADPSLYEAAPAHAGAVGGVACLLGAGWRAVGITARSEHLVDVTERWLRAQGLPLDGVIHTAVGTKHEVAQRLGVVATIEDNPTEAERLGHVCDSLLFDRPYNRDHMTVSCSRVLSWDDVVGRLCQLRLFAS
jgi:uncharacterized HAD superfamily protein